MLPSKFANLIGAFIFVLQVFCFADVPKSTVDPAFASTDSSGMGTGEWLDYKDHSYLQRHYPFYFAYGPHLSKVQFSFRSPLFEDFGLYLGYTQLMFWDLLNESKPFRDFTYNPELFYRWSFEKSNLLRSLDFGFWGHTSNGKAGSLSRSMDMVYLRFNFEKELQSWLFRFSLQASNIYNLDPTNKNIQDYVGPAAIRISFIQLFEHWVDKSEISLLATPGGKFAQNFAKGGYQLSWSFRLGGLNLIPSFYIQYYSGYAESLINYDRRVDVLRGGIVF